MSRFANQPQKKHLYDIYYGFSQPFKVYNGGGRTVNAVGLTDGYAKCEAGPNEVDNKASREYSFPSKLFEKIINVKIQNGSASYDSDKVHILNAVTKAADLNAVPLDEHPNYDAVNNLLAAKAVVAGYSIILEIIKKTEWYEGNLYRSSGCPKTANMYFSILKNSALTTINWTVGSAGSISMGYSEFWILFRNLPLGLEKLVLVINIRQKDDDDRRKHCVEALFNEEHLLVLTKLKHLELKFSRNTEEPFEVGAPPFNLFKKFVDSVESQSLSNLNTFIVTRLKFPDDTNYRAELNRLYEVMKQRPGFQFEVSTFNQ